jgi:hypothetical protein
MSRGREGAPAVLGDPRLPESLLDLRRFEPDDNFAADDQGGSRPSSGFPGQLFQILRVFDHILLDEGDPFLREKLPRRLAGVSGRVEVNDDRLGHGEPPNSGLRYQVPGFRLFDLQLATGNMQQGES